MSDFPLTNAYDQDEADRAALWRLQRSRRFATRAQIQAGLIGDPSTREALRNKFQPLLDHRADMAIPPDDADEPETVPITNQDLNAT
jgi:hypothetical protein